MVRNSSSKYEEVQLFWIFCLLIFLDTSPFLFWRIQYMITPCSIHATHGDQLLVAQSLSFAWLRAPDLCKLSFCRRECTTFIINCLAKGAGGGLHKIESITKFRPREQFQFLCKNLYSWSFNLYSWKLQYKAVLAQSLFLFCFPCWEITSESDKTYQN